MNFIPYGRQNISEDDITAVVETLKSDFLTQGPAVTLFEDAIKQYCGVKHGFAVANATCALHLAYLALDIGKGDIVWTSPNTFLSTANAALMCGADVDFVDICPKTYNISVKKLEQKLIEAKKTGKLPKVVAPVHFAGQSCDMKEIWQLSQEYGFAVVEDAAHAIGGKYLDKPVGSCEYSDITIFSFHPVKIITTAEGGMLTTNSNELSTKISSLRTHGMTRDSKLMTKESEGPWFYQMLDLGYNYRITDLQCALGLSQFTRLDIIVSKRHEILGKYRKLLSDKAGVIIPEQAEYSYSGLHLYPIQVPKEKRLEIFEHLRASNIGVNVHYIPVYLQPYYEKLGFNKGYCPNAESYYESAISLPMYPDLTDEQIKYICEKLLEVL
ncbi:UDP-4-amino-4,6-dideoxy-N-acetyl-beta-L-altrosamine transaminase [Francisella adeliensis]|uniref:UDP-4-amino-4, 6-dideoxy-N-acetyl-beta-L-altrosamine transaminase n=1 Tax=Francisella adeliensis TaxID=2007306 RepID=A0A2Z4XY31_9GAMM|nr:UDP-4-amino-4,6-dideoxy-N-acetyl-beta-L-altrosamine transaminase [Francisella adeliensis]AXA33392.1 UDP-4-amino-4,6-dideoxy-N-acetyl-beta-L-altrosamine transaminase [Francisella adeliensis]MBK2085408.1 UDP-4-amino-4,6-dideoxy-N-acetyl-beta-L-altrosamine transaminase [Francisella adeliensis]MBK2097138.1 UDP-4-amino-4,6-dideoxy-N-acetyl-beta-L-altrosamine transaminase [Francisella adeliensis]QIW11620.1 UDP-4-amino-4,6-dideoxy-N-acetyl-beta-L-altrosamine transaminase [Francisella adeliensis]QI